MTHSSFDDPINKAELCPVCGELTFFHWRGRNCLVEEKKKKVAKAKTWKYPLLDDGSVQNFVSNWDIKEGKIHVYRNMESKYIPFHMSDNHEPFEADIVITGYSRGRSAANFDAMNVNTGATYTIFMTDFIKIVRTQTIIGGRIAGLQKWVVVKRGKDFGIKLFEETE